MQQEHLVAAGDARRAGHDDPVLGPVAVHLQRDGRAGVYREPLDLESRAGVEGVVRAPGPVDAAVVDVLGTAVLPEPVDKPPPWRLRR